MLAWTATVRAQCPITPQTVTAPQTNYCNPSFMSLFLANSQNDVHYVARDQATGQVLGPLLQGNGNTFAVTTGLVSQTTTFDVWASSGQALEFDGVDDYVSLGSPSQFAFADEFAIEMWVQFDDLTNTSQMLLAKDGNGPSQRQLVLAYTGEIRIIYYNSGSQPVFLSSDPNPITDNNWHHIAAQKKSAGFFEIYLDGELIKSGNNTNTGTHTAVISGSADMRIGSRVFPNFEDHFDGQIDEVRVWNASRTQAEIQNNMYSTLNGSESNLVAYYNMEGGVPSTSLTDLTSNSIQGTLTNMNTTNAWVPGIIGLCDAVMDGTPTITVGGQTTGNLSHTICDGESITVGSSTYSAAGSYTDVFMNSVGCDSVHTTTLNINPLPQPDLGTDASICSDDDVTLSAGTVSYTGYDWSNSTTNSTLLVEGNSLSIGTYQYWVEVEAANGCLNSDTIAVTVKELPQPDLGVDLTICSTQSITLSPGSGSYEGYNWSNSSSASTLVVDNSSGIGTHEFWVEVEHDFNGCFNSDTINVTIEVCTGINETNESNSMKLFPNPATNVVTVLAVNLEQIQLLDVSGRLLKGMQLSGVGQVDLDISALPSGVYFIEGTRTDGTKSTERLMKH